MTETVTKTGSFRRRNGKARCKIPTPENLANVALYYLSRFAASEASLRRVLENRVRRASMVHASFAADTAVQDVLRRAIEAIVAQHKKSGVLNDAAFAEMKVHSLRRAGGSARRISQKLQQKGVKADVIEKALQPEEGLIAEDVEKKAALAFARRRGLGPFRKARQKKITAEEERRKDIATLARAGFSYDIIKQMLGGDLEDDDYTM